jgi:hypothetical protein
MREVAGLSLQAKYGLYHFLGILYEEIHLTHLSLVPHVLKRAKNYLMD